MTKNEVLKNLGDPVGDSVMITRNQNVRDIINLIKIKHLKCARDYDKIANSFWTGDIYTTCEKLWKWCKKNIGYNIESEEVQTISPPSVILARGSGDCKHYSLFIAGVLDALRRRGENIDWNYRFASYNPFDPTPGHVFVVVNDNGNEIWIDPVLHSFDNHKPFMYAVDKTIFTAKKPGRMNGINVYERRNIGLSRLRGHEVLGTTKETGQLIQKISPALAVVPVVGWAAAAAGEVVGFFLTVFGSKYSSTTKVRWLTQAYEFYVLAHGGVTSDNKVNESYVPTAQKWFSIVLGVPIYDICRWHTLRGENCDTGKSLNMSDSQAANNFLQYGDVKQAGVTYAQALEAAQIAKTMQYKSGDQPGIWAKMLAAPSLIDYQKQQTATAPGSSTASMMNAGFLSDFADKLGVPSWVLLLGLGIGGYMLLKNPPKQSYKKRRR